MTTLAARQRDFMAAIHGESPATGPMRRYREQALAGWHGALAATYPVVRRLVGPAFFRAASDRYAAAHPSASGDLHEYGRAFPAFIAGDAAAKALPYLADMSRLEWALHEAAFAADTAPFDFASLAAVAPDSHARIVLEPHPAARAIESPWPLEAWWRANQPDRDGAPGPDALSGRGVLACRGDGLPAPHRVDDAEWRIFQGCAAGLTLDRIAEDLAHQAPRIPEAVARLAECGAFRGFRLAG